MGNDKADALLLSLITTLLEGRALGPYMWLNYNTQRLRPLAVMTGITGDSDLVTSRRAQIVQLGSGEIYRYDYYAVYKQKRKSNIWRNKGKEQNNFSNWSAPDLWDHNFWYLKVISSEKENVHFKLQACPPPSVGCEKRNRVLTEETNLAMSYTSDRWKGDNTGVFRLCGAMTP